MTNKIQPGRGPDRFIFANNNAGFIQLAKTRAGLASQGITSAADTEVIAETVCLVLTVTGKRPGAGRIAADMKARKAQ